jgi:hypothetical protein
MYGMQSMFLTEFSEIGDDNPLAIWIDEAMMRPLNLEKVVSTVLVRPASMAADPAVGDRGHVCRVESVLPAEGSEIGNRPRWPTHGINKAFVPSGSTNPSHT